MGSTTFLVKYGMKNVTAGMSHSNFLFLRMIGICKNSLTMNLLKTFL